MTGRASFQKGKPDLVIPKRSVVGAWPNQTVVVVVSKVEATDAGLHAAVAVGLR